MSGELGIGTGRHGAPDGRSIGRAETSHTSDSTPGVALSILMLFAMLGVVFACAVAGGMVATANMESWYDGIAKPQLTPANWAFPIVWQALFFLMGLSGWIVWRTAGGLNAAGGALSLFAAQLMLNFAWTVLFFGMHRPGLAIFEILALDAAIGATIWAFWHHSRLAAGLMVPYLAWSLFATWLNIAVWQMNS